MVSPRLSSDCAMQGHHCRSTGAAAAAAAGTVLHTELHLASASTGDKRADILTAQTTLLCV